MVGPGPGQSAARPYAPAGPPRPVARHGGVAASWLEPGKSPISALHEFCQARQRLLPPEQRHAWQPKFEASWAESATCTARAGEAVARAVAPDAKAARTRAAGQLMRLLCPEYDRMCPAAPPTATDGGAAALPPPAKAPPRPRPTVPEEEREEGELEEGEIGG